LTGPAFLGLRRLARRLADEMWIADLGGSGRGATHDENVFAIQTPVAIVTLFRAGDSSAVGSPAKVYYRRVDGTAGDKLAALTTLEPPPGTAWAEVNADEDAALIPETGDGMWRAVPLLSDLFPWQQPGVNWARAWAVSPSQRTLEARWQALLARQGAEREAAFVTARTGRNVHTKAAGLPKIAELAAGAPHRPLSRLGFRSFDRQWAFDDPRLAARDSPSLWQAQSDRQVFFSSMLTYPLGEGPALVATADVPDFHYFRGRGGKDVIPLYRDRDAAQPNMPEGLLTALSQHLGQPVSVEDLAAYVSALLAHPGYQAVFAVPLQTPGPHVPITCDMSLFGDAVRIGREVVWLQTYGARFWDQEHPRGRVPMVEGIGWDTPVGVMPASPESISYDPRARQLTIGDGTVSGVTPKVWDYSVSGFKVVPRWIGSRTRKGVGRAANPSLASPLDRIRPDRWEDEWNDELLDLLRVLTLLVNLEPAQEDLLKRIAAGPLIRASALPHPTALERRVPKTVPARMGLAGPTPPGR
jgi:hypothetical protein